MTVRFKIALTIFITGALTALGVIATVLFAFQRFEHESAYHRADAFLGRVTANYDNLFEMHERHPEEFGPFLRNLVLFEPDTQLYLLDAHGTVLVSTGEARLAPGFRVTLAMIHTASSVVSSTTPMMKASAGRAKALRKASPRSSLSTGLWLTT